MLKRKLFFLLVVLILIGALNVIFFQIAQVAGFGNHYSFVEYLYMPLLGLSILFILLLFLERKKASIVYVLLNIAAIVFLLLKNTLESHEFLNTSFLEDSRFCYVVINSIREMVTTETTLINIAIYTVVFTVYYYLVFSSATFLSNKYLKSSTAFNKATN